MIRVNNIETYGWEAAIRGMRNPMNSWEMSDSIKCTSANGYEVCYESVYDYCPRYENNKTELYCIGRKDYELMKKLSNSGNDHGKFLRMIMVTMDITAPFYWWKEFDTYKVGTTANSCSTMHKIAAKKFVLEDFSFEHMSPDAINVLGDIIKLLNKSRDSYLETKNKRYWWDMIQILPTSYNQLRTVSLNYAVLKNMYHGRKNHKLDEWVSFCETIKSLPYSDLITE